MDIILYLDPFFEFLNLPPDMMLFRMLVLYAWVPLAFLLMWGIWELRVMELQNRWAGTLKYVLLAIDIPKGNEQSPKAVENFLAYLAGGHSSLNLLDKYVEGKFPLGFSLEIVSIEGYTQFIVRTPAQFQHMVESALYSVYPDAEITEVDDYTTGFPKTFPDNDYDVWGGEFIQARPHVYPIKVYKDFEHNYGKPEFHFRDPMGALMDLCSSLRKGEHLWFQLVILPEDQKGFLEAGAKEISKILGEKPKAKTTVLSQVADGLADMLSYLTGLGLNAKVEAKESTPLKMMDLKPEQKKQVEAIQEKISKECFKFKIRMVYMAKKDVKNNPKVVNGFVGYMKQFRHNDLNNLKPDMSRTATSTKYLFKNFFLKYRKDRIVRNYISRSGWSGRLPGFLSIEEIATLWHFPNENVVKAPLIQKTPGRKAEPPITLPIGDEVSSSEALMDEIFVMDSGPARPQPPSRPVEENIFDLSFEEDEVVKNGSGTVAVEAGDDAFADIFTEPEKTPAPKPADKDGAPPSNLPFA